MEQEASRDYYSLYNDFNNNSNPQKFGSFLNKSISKQSYDEKSKKKIN